MLINTSPTAAASFCAVQPQAESLSERFHAYLIEHGTSASADITKALDTDGRNHTRLRDLWMQGRVDKVGVGIAAATNQQNDLWKAIPDGSEYAAARRAATHHYWVDKKRRLLEEQTKLPQRIDEANKMIEGLQ
jgi:hypothetical protein